MLFRCIVFLQAFFLLLCAIPGNAQYEWKAGPVKIKGQVTHWANPSAPAIVSFTFIDWKGLTEKKTTTIQPDGSFYLEHHFFGTQDFTIEFGRKEKLLASPGETLQFEINAALSDPSIEHTSVDTSFIHHLLASKNKEQACLQISDSMLSTITDPEKDQGAIKDMTAIQYKNYVLDNRIRKQEALKKLGKKYLLPNSVYQWAKDHIRFEAFDLLLRYRWEHPMANGIKKADFKLPASYYSFLDSVSFTFPDILSSSHASFLHEWYRHVRDDIPEDSIALLNRFRKEGNFYDYILMQVRFLERGSHLFIRDLFLTRYFYNILQGNTAIEFEQTFQPRMIRHPFFAQILEAKHTAVLQFLSQSEIKSGTTITVADSLVTTRILDSLIFRYKGKVVYIDFWAPWCSPCLAEMPAWKELQSAYKDTNIIFLQLANRCSQATWKATIAHQSLSGIQVLLTNDQFNILSSVFNISGIPHYVLIDKKGRISNGNAPAPGEKEVIRRELDKLLLQ